MLLEIGDTIDSDDDVVMVYLAGSSNDNHVLTAINPPLELIGLSAQGLRQLLDAAGIRWRIIVVSTCNAGAWADALKDDETAVIASSAADVHGSDCAGGIALSSFGEAFFGDAVRPAEIAEHLVVERLQTERHAVHPGAGEVAEAGGFDRGGIGLQRDLDVLGDAPMARRGVDQCGHCLGRH